MCFGIIISEFSSNMNAIADAWGELFFTPQQLTGPPFNIIFFNILSPQDAFVRSALPTFSLADTLECALEIESVS